MRRSRRLLAAGLLRILRVRFRFCLFVRFLRLLLRLLRRIARLCVLVLLLAAGEGFLLIRLPFRGLDTGVDVDMLRHLNLAAGERAAAVIAALVMLVENGLQLVADQDPFRLIAVCRVAVALGLRLGAGEYPVPLIAVVAVLVILAAGQIAPDQGVAVLAVLVAGAFRLAAGQDFLLPPAAGVVPVLLNLLQGADEIAVQVIAAFVMLVHNKIRKAADQVPLIVVAAPVMLVKPVLPQSLQGAQHGGLGGDGLHGIAGVRMGVGFQPADGVLFHGNGGQNQGVGGAEHNHRRHGADHLHPAFSAPLSGQKLRRPGQKPMFHVSHLLFLWWNLSRIILSPPAGSGARCGRRSFPRSDPPQCSPRPCSESPPTRCGGPP